MSWCFYQVNQQRVVVAWVKANGGTVGYDYQVNKRGAIDFNKRKPEKPLLRILFGFGDFPRVVGVNFSEPTLEDKEPFDLQPLASLKELRAIRLVDYYVSDLQPLTDLTNLEELFVVNAPLSDLTPIASLKKLTNLTLYETEVSDLSPLAGLTNLEELYLWHTHVSDEEVDELKDLLSNCLISKK